MRFEIGEGLQCDLDALVDSRLLIQANSGGGKSWCIRRLLEQTFGHVQHLVIDPEGEFASLRDRFDYVLAARRGGDTAADPRSAKLLAARLLELKASAILDIYELKAHDRIRFVRYFLEALVDAPKALWHPALIVIDEAHVYCPQKGDAESANAVIDLATRGRKRGFCPVIATQRLSKLHKDAAAECNNKLIGRSALDVDMRRASEELGFAGREEQHQLRELEPGEFFAFGPGLSRTVTKVMVGGVQTEHPKAGARIAFTAPPPTEKVRALLPQLSDLPAEAEAERKDNETLRREVATLKREATLSRREQAPPDEAVIERRIEVATATLRKEHHGALAGESRQRGRLERVVRDATDTLTKLAERMAAAVNGQRPAPTPPPPIAPRMPPAMSPPARYEPEATPAAPMSPEMSHEMSQEVPGIDQPLKKAERLILTALAQHMHLEPNGLALDHVAAISGYSGGTGHFGNMLGSLRGLGLIEPERGSPIRITPAGLEALGDYEPLPTGPELVDWWCGKAPKAAREMLKYLASIYPESASLQDVADATNYAGGTGHFGNMLGWLRTRKLVLGERGQPLRMSEHLA
jgi:hypothetical protein